MKKYFVGAIIFLFTINVEAQWYQRKYGVQSIGFLNETQLTKVLQHTKKNINTGQILTGAGICFEIIGGVLVASNFCIFCTEEQLARVNGGTVLFAGGFITMMVGIPLWAVNGHRKKDIELALVRINAHSYLGNNQPIYFGGKQPSILGLSVKISF